LQRFIAEDPLGFGGGQTNLYAYVSNNPLRFIDPSGLLSPSPSLFIPPMPVGLAQASAVYILANIHPLDLPLDLKAIYCGADSLREKEPVIPDHCKRNSFSVISYRPIGSSKERWNTLPELLRDTSETIGEGSHQGMTGPGIGGGSAQGMAGPGIGGGSAQGMTGPGIGGGSAQGTTGPGIGSGSRQGKSAGRS
jgi:hypothetical protein